MTRKDLEALALAADCITQDVPASVFEQFIFCVRRACADTLVEMDLDAAAIAELTRYLDAEESP